VRRAFIAFGFAVFALYCWASVAYQNQVDVPAYRPVTIDLLNGKSRDAWDRSQQEQFQRLIELENKHYQLPEGAPGDPDRPLTADDFTAYIDAHPGSPVRMELRDASAIDRLLAQNFTLRDSIMESDDPRAKVVYAGGSPIHKAMLDDLRRRGIATLTVSGHAAPVNFQLGTALMIAVIFFTLVAALKPVLWNPFLAMLERRRRELEEGAEAERQNQQEAARFEEEKARRHAGLDREVRAERLDGQRENAVQANAIVREARERERTIRQAGLRDIGERAGMAKEEMDRRVPELADVIADALTPGRGEPPWERLGGSGSAVGGRNNG
jgi:F0F1-type ATP synthase membrane subunit b/b'